MLRGQEAKLIVGGETYLNVYDYCKKRRLASKELCLCDCTSGGGEVRKMRGATGTWLTP